MEEVGEDIRRVGKQQQPRGEKQCCDPCPGSNHRPAHQKRKSGEKQIPDQKLIVGRAADHHPLDRRRPVHRHRRPDHLGSTGPRALREPAGECFGLLGPNGAGKTTTIECIEGLRQPDAGSLRVLAGDPALKESAFKNDKNLQVIAKRTMKALNGNVTGFKLKQDKDESVYEIIFDLKKNGHTVTTTMDVETFRSPQFTEIRALLEQVSILGEPPYRDIAEDPKNPVILESTKALVEHILNAGKKGIGVQRYKGLGEMNPAQLWETTMNPEKRTLLQVKVEDFVDADEIFTLLMGEEVEPRREFIQNNALEVSTLDI